MSDTPPAALEIAPCNGWSYHVFTLGADRCSICGFRRYAPAKLTPPEPAP